jgi:hypothetical protein
VVAEGARQLERGVEPKREEQQRNRLKADEKGSGFHGKTRPVVGRENGKRSF